MKRRKFIGIAAGTLLAVGTTSFCLSDRGRISRNGLKEQGPWGDALRPDEKEILYLASLAPSGHNTQPWFIQYLEPFHWVIGNDKSKWLPAVDPTQREIILSIGAFIQNLEYASATFGYSCNWNLLASTNQDERIMEVRLVKSGSKSDFDNAKIESRRTLRSGFDADTLKKENLEYLIDQEKDFIHYMPRSSRESQYIDEQTIEANRLQAYREPAQKELADWVRFSSNDAEKYRDGLTTAGMEIDGISGWIVRNFYDKNDVLTPDFREKGIERVRNQVSESAGWLLITSVDDSLATLLETGRRMQRLFLKVREKGIGIHPMTQILEEASTQQIFNRSIGINDSVQFILRTGYVKNYPPPVSLRRPVDWFLRF